MTPLVRALRPHQWVKNLLVFAAPAGAGILDEPGALGHTVFALAAFCAASSAGYLVNDVIDRDLDRHHPTKSHRPVASGALTVSSALWAAVALAGVSLAAAVAVRPALAVVVGAYLGSTMAYSVALKRIPWVETVPLVAAFVLRAHGGAVATDVDSSGWFVIVVGAVGAFVVLRKRWCERRASGAITRPVLGHYRGATLRVVSDVAAGAAIAGHLSWALAGPGTPVAPLVASAAFAVAVARYGMVTTDGDANGDPVLVVARDPILLGLGALWSVGFVGASW